MAALDDSDYNGECFILGSEGEAETLLAKQRYVVRTPLGGFPGTPFDATSADHKAWLAQFFVDQVRYLLTREAHAPADICVKVGYIRMLAARHGLLKPLDNPAAHNCRYSDAINADEIDDWGVDDTATRIPIAALTAPMRAALRERFCNMVCAVAYFFRTRGHHWQEQFDSRYVRVWRAARYEEDNPGLAWNYVARDALHGIYPDDLDAYWRNSADAARCAGTFRIRVSCAPAGVAGITAVRRGLADLRMVAPRVEEMLPQAVAELQHAEAAVAADRWAGSVNRRFYDAPAVVVNEAELSTLAAVIRAALTTFADQAPLLQSKALERLASQAPITGAVIASMIATAVKNPAMSRILLPAGPV